jgi:hypothetical protein
MAIRNFAFPDDGDAPTHSFKLHLHTSVTGGVILKLSLPELNIRFRSIAISAMFMTMPKATVNEKCDFFTWEY